MKPVIRVDGVGLRGGLLNTAFTKTGFVSEVLTGANCVGKSPEL